MLTADSPRPGSPAPRIDVRSVEPPLARHRAEVLAGLGRALKTGIGQFNEVERTLAAEPQDYEDLRGRLREADDMLQEPFVSFGARRREPLDRARRGRPREQP
jgi:hypothetical protein